MRSEMNVTKRAFPINTGLSFLIIAGPGHAKLFDKAMLDIVPGAGHQA